MSAHPLPPIPGAEESEVLVDAYRSGQVTLEELDDAQVADLATAGDCQIREDAVDVLLARLVDVRGCFDALSAVVAGRGSRA